MRKFVLVFTALILAVGFGVLNASTTQQVAAPSDRIDALGMMSTIPWCMSEMNGPLVVGIGFRWTALRGPRHGEQFQ